MPPVAERVRRAYPALLERAGVGSIPASSNAQNVPSFRRWRFEIKLSLFTKSEKIETNRSNLTKVGKNMEGISTEHGMNASYFFLIRHAFPV